jgi:hypothetical protein
MIGAAEKGVQAANLKTPPIGEYDGFDLKKLPKYICYKAAYLKTQMTLRYMLAALAVIFAVYASIREYSFLKFMERYRLKEYILAPGVMDFTAASPQTVTESYVNDAVTDFLTQLGNVNPTNIDEQYEALSRSMSPDLQIKFKMEVADWVNQIKENGISQIVRINQKEIKTDEKGHYRITAMVRAEFYSQSNFLGHEDQVIEMQLKLVPPDSGRRWYLQITRLGWNKIEDFRAKKSLQNAGE